MIDLREALEGVADRADPTALPSPASIRELGQRRHRRSLAGATVAGAVALLAAALMVQRSVEVLPTPPAGDRPTIHGMSTTRRVPVPHVGPLAFGAGAVWVVDEGDKSVVDGEPTGELLKLDPDTGAVLDRIPHAVGAYPVVDADTLWLSTQRTVDKLTRVDLLTGQIRRTTTSAVTTTPGPAQVAGGYVWVANFDAATVAQVDPDTLRLVREVPVGQAGRGLPMAAASSSTDVWYAIKDTGRLVRIDTASGRVVSTLTLPAPVGSLALRGTLLFAETATTLIEIDVATTGHESVTRTLHLGLPEGSSGAGPQALEFGGGYLWGLRTRPNELLRINPDNMRVVERVKLPSGSPTMDAIDLAVTDRAVWVRLPGQVLQLRPH